MAYEIRQAVVDDWPAISAFVDRSYASGAPFKQRPRWDWELRNTPYRLDGGVPVWLALHDGVVVGQMSVQPGLLWLDGEPLPIGWLVDLLVDPVHRGEGLSRKINTAIMAGGRTLITLTMSPPTRHIMQRAGGITLPQVNQMFRPQRISRKTIAILLDGIGSNRPAWRSGIGLLKRSVVGPALLAFGANASRHRLPRRLQGGLLRDVETVDPASIDALAAVRVQRTPASFDRSAAWFAWRFGSAPDLSYRYATLTEGDATRSILVWREPHPIELPVGTIADILADPDDAVAVGASIDAAVARMAAYEGIVAGACDPRLVTALSQRGFITVRKHYPTVVSTDRAVLDRIAACKGPWHLSKADQDWDQIHPAR